jgi:hypothetical protein
VDWSADEALEQERTRGVKIASDGCGDWHPAHHMTRGGLAGLSLTWKSGKVEKWNRGDGARPARESL